MSDLLKVEERGAITTLTLNRGAQFNPLSSAMLSALQTAFKQVSQNAQCAVVILAAEGRAFCAGHDLKEMRANPSEAWQRALFDQCSAMMLQIQSLPQPVIARVQGVATAAGCQLVSMCDLAVASTDARFATSGVNLGLFCSTPAVGVSRNLGRKKALELLLTGDFLSAQEALAQGLINAVVAPDDLVAATNALAEKIASKSQAAIRVGKKLFYAQIEQGVATAYETAASAMACNMQSVDAQAGIDAFIAKKPTPLWQGQ